MMVGTKSQYFMLSQHCAEGALEVRGRCAEGDGGDKKSVFYAESALRGRCAEGDGGDKKSVFYAESALRGRCAEGDGGDKKSVFYAESALCRRGWWGQKVSILC